MEKLSSSTPAPALPAPTAPPVAPGSPPGPPANAAPAVDAAALAAKHGGLKGGRPRKDGLVPGSPEAAEADRQRDIERKRLARANARAVLAVSQAPAVPGSPDTGATPAVGPAPVPWDAGVLKPIFEQLLPAVEKFHVEKLVAKAARIGAPPDMLKELRQDAAWPGPAKTAVMASGPLCAAKWLNQLGVGAENAPEVILGTALAAIGAHTLMLHAKMDELIKARQAKEPPANAPAPKSA